MTIFRRFPTIFRRFPKIFQNWLECRTNVSEHFRKISGHYPKTTEYFQRRPKNTRRCFDHTPTNLSLVKGSKHHSSRTDTFTCEDIISSHIDVIYRAGGPYGKKSCARGRRPRAVLKTKGTVFSHTDRPSPVNNMLTFFLQ